MAVTYTSRPQAAGLGSAVAASTVNASGFVNVFKTAHGLTAGTIVYVVSNDENINGFWIVGGVDANNFSLIGSDGVKAPFFQAINITYYAAAFNHGWSCAHLPIMYALSSDKYPTNNVDVQRTIISQQTDSGYTRLKLSGSLGTFNELQFVTLVDTNGVSTVYQIVNIFSTSDVSINLAFSGINPVTGGTLKIYYSNYNVVVNVWSGLNSAHQWASKKPYALAATLRIVPDSNNLVRFSIAEILKASLTLRNGLTLGTLPNNIDFFTQFYIETAESYDSSDGYTITTFQSGFSSDQGTFEGVGAMAMLEFKNQYSGFLTQYIMNSATAKFLTLFAIPVLFSCNDNTPLCYQDISFINNFGYSIQSFTMRHQFYKNGVLQTTQDQFVQAAGMGIMRVRPDAGSCSYDRDDITLFGTFKPDAPNSFSQAAGNGVWSYIGGVYPVNYTGGAGLTSRLGYVGIYAPPGIYSLIGNYQNVNGTTGQIRCSLYDENFVELGGNTQGLTASPGVTGTFTDAVTITKTARYMVFKAINTSGSTMSININYDMAAQVLQLSETKQFSVDCGCSPKDLRLTWLNNLGGFDYWNFHTPYGGKDHLVDIGETGQLKTNIFPSWPNSYGANADTINKQTYRTSTKQLIVRSQYMNQANLDAVAYIKSSPLVQIITSQTTKRTVIVDKDSFTKYSEDDKLFQIQFTITFTDDIPSSKT